MKNKIEIPYYLHSVCMHIYLRPTLLCMYAYIYARDHINHILIFIAIYKTTPPFNEYEGKTITEKI